MDCVFCKIVNKELSTKIIYEDDFAMAFLDNNPRSIGHTVVIPKSHVQDILELIPSQVGPLFMAVRSTAAKMKIGLKPDGFNIGINQGTAGGQAIFHLHVHIFPRFDGDGGGSVHLAVNNPPTESLGEVARKILG